MSRNSKGQFTKDPRPELKGDGNPAKRLDVRKKMSLARRGRKLTKEWRAKIGDAIRGEKNGNYGRKFSEEHRRKISESRKGKPRLRGELSNNWKGGLTEKNRLIRTSIEYKLWRQAVYERDNFTCIWCGKTGNLNADHIKSFSKYPELRFAIDNGRALCHDCHKTTDNYGWKAKKEL